MDVVCERTRDHYVTFVPRVGKPRIQVFETTSILSDMTTPVCHDRRISLFGVTESLNCVLKERTSSSQVTSKRRPSETV